MKRKWRGRHCTTIKWQPLKLIDCSSNKISHFLANYPISIKKVDSKSQSKVGLKILKYFWKVRFFAWYLTKKCATNCAQCQVFEFWCENRCTWYSYRTLIKIMIYFRLNLYFLVSLKFQDRKKVFAMLPLNLP